MVIYRAVREDVALGLKTSFFLRPPQGQEHGFTCILTRAGNNLLGNAESHGSVPSIILESKKTETENLPQARHWGKVTINLEISSLYQKFK